MMHAMVPAGRTSLPVQYLYRRWSFWLWIPLALACLTARAGPQLPADGLTFTVNATADDSDAVIGDGVCETIAGNGVCTLRAAIEEANAQPTDSTINFDLSPVDPGYNGTSWTISLLSVLPELSSNLTIEGPGPSLLNVTRSSAGFFRIFTVTSTGTVNISGLTLSNGNADSENGGGILNENGGVLKVLNCILSSNQALRGGGISNQSTSTTNLMDSIVTGNIATDRGGGITNQDTGVVNVMNSTVDFNQGSGGAGIRQSDIGTMTVTNCTVWGNLDSGVGGVGIFNALGGALSVSNCTVSGNHGAGLFNKTPGPFVVKSSIVAQNGGTTGEPIDDVVGRFSSEGFNLIGGTSGNGFTEDTDKTGTRFAPLDARLDPNGPQDNGGLTPTVGLLALSPAIDKGTSLGLSGDLNADQRGPGFARTFDDPAVANAKDGDGTDIGAFEAQTAVPTPTPTPTPTATPTPTPTATPTPSPATFANISTRLDVEIDDNVLIGGFIITGSEDKAVLIRAIGPSLPLSGTLADPVLQLFDSSGRLIVLNDNWKESYDAEDIIDLGFAPTNDSEAAILRRLEPAAYTAIVSGVDNTTGVALIEVYDLDSTVDSKLQNISTRGFVQTGSHVMIGGIIVQGDTSTSALVRALGPSLPLSSTLSDPVLDLHNASGDLIASNNNWKDMQQTEIEATGIPPSNDAESAILMTLTPGLYTAVVRGENDSTGVALVEVYQIDL